jgi:hypothetical protein
MAVDNKYGKVTTEFGTIGEDEPVVVFRAQDALLPEILDIYGALCTDHGAPQHHLDLILSTKDQVLDWQHENQPRIPNSNAYMERTGGA